MIGLREIQDLLYSITIMMLQDLALDHLKREKSVEGLFSGDVQLNLLFLKKVRIIQHLFSESRLIVQALNLELLEETKSDLQSEDLFTPPTQK